MANNTPPNTRSEIIRSAAFYLKEFEAKEDAGSRGQRVFSGTRMKSVAMPALYWLLQHLPLALALAPVKLLIFIVRKLYWWPNNPFRQSCESICQLAVQAGHHHDPKQVYQQLFRNVIGTVENYFHLYRLGIDAVVDHVDIRPQDAQMMNHLLEKHGGVILAVAHNLGSAFSSLAMNRAFPLLLVTRNSSTIERTKIAVDFYERMQVTIIMVRGGNPFELSRTLFSVLRTGKTVAATVDSLDHSDNQATVDMFGLSLGMAPWAAKIAVRMGVPVVPSYFCSDGKQINAIFGAPILKDSANETVQEYTRFFEQHILSHPASWGFLLDKRWRKVLQQASNKIKSKP